MAANSLRKLGFIGLGLAAAGAVADQCLYNGIYCPIETVK